jgi:Lar family restriction alleviation protein
MADDNPPDPKTEEGRAAISAAAGIGRGCPFCGHREKTKQGWRFFRDPGTHATQVECKHCGARGPLCIPSEQKALAAWNERQGEGGLLQQRRLTTQH